VADDVRGRIAAKPARGEPPVPSRFAASPPPHVLRDAMTKFVGLERDRTGLLLAIDTIAGVERAGAPEPALLNMTATAKLVTAAALARRESRGAHFRSDYPQTSAAGARSFLTLAEADKIVAQAGPASEQASRAAL